MAVTGAWKYFQKELDSNWFLSL